ncbi:sortase A [Arthrobacter pigmenti]|uniref:Sortase A n=1 Tax=Arthrobacter pigmenti TaxID=271432 RepID=A0A846RXB0_9MICC|nr:sortase A [Arthrobacter pigmenti]
MTESGGSIAVARRDRSARRPARRRRGVFQTLVQVFGELLITAGILLLLFVAWELWWTNIESNAKQEEAVENFIADLELPPTLTGETNNNDDGGTVAAENVPVLGGLPAGETFAVVYVPRFGEDYTRPVTSGVGTAVLDNLGLGHYPETGMPGAVGNFALAGHRQTNGAVLDNIHTFVPGDRIYVQTREGYYTYVYRNTQIVLPNRVDVLAPVPTQPDAEPVERILTLTSCNPRFGSQERIIAYAVMESFRPLDAGPPEGIASQVYEAAEGAA